MLTDTTRQALRLPAIAMLAGQTLYIAITQLHAGGEANDHHHTFETYADNGIWTAVHPGQFIGIAAILAGMAGVFLTFEARTGTMKAIAAFGLGLSVAALALYGGAAGSRRSGPQADRQRLGGCGRRREDGALCKR